MFVKITSVCYLMTILCLSDCENISEPKFRVLTQNELMVRVPRQEDNAKLILMRISVIQNNRDDIEIGENFIQDGQVHISDKRLRLKSGDVVNYLLGFRTSDHGYKALTGKYVFDGEYKHPSRLRRNAESDESDDESENSEEFNPTASRFGRRGHRRHHNHGHNSYGKNWGRGPGYPNPDPGFNPFPNGGPGFGNPPYGKPYQFNPFLQNNGPFGVNCNDHRHDICHNNPNDNGPITVPIVTTPRNVITSSTDPDIDIRFAD